MFGKGLSGYDVAHLRSPFVPWKSKVVPVENTTGKTYLNKKRCVENSFAGVNFDDICGDWVHS